MLPQLKYNHNKKYKKRELHDQIIKPLNYIYVKLEVYETFQYTLLHETLTTTLREKYYTNITIF